MFDEKEKADDLKIKLYEADYYYGLGQPFLLLSWDSKETHYFFDNYFLLVRKQGEYTIRNVTIDTGDTTPLLFPDFDTLLQKEILQQAQYYVFYNLILPVLESNNKSSSGLPKFEEIDISSLNQIKQLCPKALGRIREASRMKDLKEYITYILTIKNNISEAREI